LGIPPDKSWRSYREALSQALIWALGLALAFTLLGSEDLGRLSARVLNDNFLCDLYTRLAPRDRQISRHIVLIDLGRPGAGRTDRRLLARTIDRCFQGGAAAIGVDINLEAPQPGDEVLAASLHSAAPRVVLVQDLKRPLLCPALAHIPGLRTGMGNFLVSTQDPVIRQAKLWWGRRQEHEGFGAAILKAAGMEAGLRAAPFEADGRLRLRFPRDPALVFPVLKVQDLLAAAAPPDLKGQVVLIGNLSPAARREDSYRTPVGELPGLYLHAVALNTLIQGRFIRTLPQLLGGRDRAPDLVSFLVLLVLITPLVLIFRHRGRKATWLWLVGLLVGLPFLGYFAFTSLDLILPVAALNAGVLVLGVCQLRRLRLDLDQHFQALSTEHAELTGRLQQLGLFEPFRDLELALRRLAVDRFRGHYGDNWEAQALESLSHRDPRSARTLTRIRDDLRVQGAAEAITFLNATTFGDWRTILDQFWDIFAPVFSAVGDKKRLLGELADIRRVRNMVYHNNPVPDDLKSTVLEHCRRLLAIINQTYESGQK
jgi:CHASE2 domain-containing sensor protein